MSLFNTILNELKYDDFKKEQTSIVSLFPTFYDRVKAVKDNGGIQLVNRSDKDDRAVWAFMVASGTKKNKSYVVRVRFENIEDVIKEQAKDPEMWNADHTHLNLQKLGRVVMYNTDLSFSSDSPGDKWWGHNTIRTDKDAELDNPNDHQPNIRNPEKAGIVGKHAQLVLSLLPNYISTMSSHLRDEYGKEIAKIEQDALHANFNPKDKSPEPAKKFDGTKDTDRIKALNDPRLKALKSTSESRKLFEEILNEMPWIDVDGEVIDLTLEKKPTKEAILNQIVAIYKNAKDKQDILKQIDDSILYLNKLGINKEDIDDSIKNIK